MSVRIGDLRLGDIHLRRYPVGIGMILIWLTGAFGLGVAVYRWIYGLGASTSLSDGRGWGIWISFDLLSGIGLAAGAFTVAAAVYIFNIKKLYPIVRAVILTGFIGYILEALTILADLGFPQRIWTMIIHWNIRSPLFLVGWCVMLYTAVLLLEFSPVVFEALHWNVPLKIIRMITIPLIVAGIILSTLHQSSLGALLTAMPYRIHPLFYSPLLPLYFYLTAIAGGLTMTVFEAFLSSYAYQFKFEHKLVSLLTKAVPYILGIYVLLRIGELIVTGKYTYLLQGGWPAFLWIIEIVGGAVIPALMLADPYVRNNHVLVVWASVLVMGGIIINRFNASLVFMEGDFYLPHWMEIAVSLGLTSLGVIMFDAAARFLPLFPEPKQVNGKHL